MKCKDLKPGMRVNGLGIDEVVIGPAVHLTNGKSYTATEGQVIVVYSPTQDEIDLAKGRTYRTVHHLSEQVDLLKEQVVEIVLERHGKDKELTVALNDVVSRLRISMNPPEIQPLRAVSVFSADDDITATKKAGKTK